MNFNKNNNLIKVLKSQISFYFKNKEGAIKKVQA